MDYKLLVADIHGTLVHHQSDGSEIGSNHEVKLAVDRARERGKLVTLATGANYPWVSGIVRALDIRTPVIANCGSRVIDPDRERVIWEQRLNPGVARQVVTYLGGSGIETNFKVGLGFPAEVPFAELRREAVDGAVYIDLVDLDDEPAIANIMNFVDSLEATTARVVPSPRLPQTHKDIIITHEKASKYHALRWLQAELGVSAAETIGIGDSANDLPLFAASGLKIAIGNASSALKAAADITVSSVYEHGLAEAIDTYLIPRS